MSIYNTVFFYVGLPAAAATYWPIFNFNDYGFSGKIIWTTLLEFTLIIFIAKYWM